MNPVRIRLPLLLEPLASLLEHLPGVRRDDRAVGRLDAGVDL